MIRVLLWGWYGFENLGDDLLLKVMITHLRGEITVPMKTLYNFKGIHQISRNYKEFLLGAFHNDVVIIGPGGLFPFDNKAKVLFYYLIAMFWKILNCKVIFFGIGISERMSNFSSILWRKIAKQSDLFISRNEKMLKRVELLESEKIHSMADAVFAYKFKWDCVESDDFRVVVSVANLQDASREIFDNTVKIWRTVIKYLCDLNFKVDLIAFTKEKDDRMIDAILADSEISGMVLPIYYKDAIENLENWNKYKFAICMRFHSLVLSILAGVPAVPIAYGHKTLSLAEKCGLSDYTLIWNNFQGEYYGKKIQISANQILRKIEWLCQNLESTKSRLEEQREEFVNSATEAFLQLETILYD